MPSRWGNGRNRLAGEWSCDTGHANHYVWIGLGYDSDIIAYAIIPQVKKQKRYFAIKDAAGYVYIQDRVKKMGIATIAGDLNDTIVERICDALNVEGK